MASSQNWYYFLVPQKQADKRSLINNGADVSSFKNKMVIAQSYYSYKAQKDFPRYTTFNTFYEYYKFYKTLDKNSRKCYEIIFDKFPCKPYCDLGY